MTDLENFYLAIIIVLLFLSYIVAWKVSGKEVD